MYRVMKRGVVALLGAAIALGVAAPEVKADPMVSIATEAIPDAYAKHGGGHAVWLPGYIGGLAGTPTFVFDTVGTFTEFADGTATLTGMIHAQGNPLKGFHLTAAFGKGDIPGTMTPFNPGPKKELKDIAYSENGGPVNTNDWDYYYIVEQVTLIGKDDFTGLSVEIDHKPDNYAMGFQVGVGANGKNVNNGASGWFYYNTIAATGTPFDETKGHGDFNIDLEPVPEPGTLALFGAAALGAFVWRRRRTS